MRTVILTPFRGDNGGRRDELWAFTQSWLGKYHRDWWLYQAGGADGPFNRGSAINAASRLATDWDVAVICDADNICDPDMLRAAAQQAHDTGGCVFPFSAYIYADQQSSDNLMQHNNWFIAPDTTRYRGNTYEHTVRHQHCSGIQAISCKSYDAIGGIPELTGWGAEDFIAEILLKTFGGPMEWLPGSAIHLWHVKPPEDQNVKRNRAVYHRVRQLQKRPEQLRAYMATLGHQIP